MPVPKKVVPLHPQSREMAKDSGIFAQAESRKKLVFMPSRSRKNRLFEENAEIAQLVEHNLAKVGVAGPSPVFRSLVEQKRDIKEWP